MVEHVTRLRGDLRPDWAQPAQEGGSYRVEITGEPSYVMDVSPTSRNGDHNYAAILAAAGRIVNAIPDVIAAAPGIRTTLDLPLVTGKGVYRRRDQASGDAVPFESHPGAVGGRLDGGAVGERLHQRDASAAGPRRGIDLSRPPGAVVATNTVIFCSSGS